MSIPCDVCDLGIIRYEVAGYSLLCERCFFKRPYLYNGKCLSCRKMVKISDCGCLCYDDIVSDDDDDEEIPPYFSILKKEYDDEEEETGESSNNNNKYVSAPK